MKFYSGFYNVSIPFLSLFIIATLFQVHLKAAPADNDPKKEELSKIVTHFNKKGVDIRPLLNDERFEYYEGISDRFKKSAERKIESIDDYKRVIDFDGKSRLIEEFMAEHSVMLAEAESRYGISKHLIAAIIGVESAFGRVTGSYNPFNAYVSMIIEDYRAPFAMAQLEELIKFVDNRNLDVFELNSSYAGAMAYAQFIPYSLNKWFVGDDIFDMNNNILSVANYLAYFLERTGSIEKAVMRYNPSSLYTRAVLDLSKEAERLAES